MRVKQAATLRAFALVLTLGVSFGCETNKPASPSPAPTSVVPATSAGSAAGGDTTAQGSASAVTPPNAAPTGSEPTSAKLKGEGSACLNDTMCPGFLRCVERACTVPPAMTGKHDAQTPLVVFRKARGADSAQIGKFYVELAIEAHEQQRGLMFRQSMQDDWGMIFVYPNDGFRSFWMQNTYIPLDMVFIDTRGFVVGVVHNAEPLTRSSRNVEGDSRYVLELNAGTAARLGIKRGVWMSMQNVREELAPRP